MPGAIYYKFIKFNNMHTTLLTTRFSNFNYFLFAFVDSFLSRYATTGNKYTICEIGCTTK